MTKSDEANILILSPSLALQELMGQWREGGTKCCSVTTIDEAAEQINAKDYDLFIMDVSSGLNNEKLQIVQAQCKGKTPVIMLVEKSLQLTEVLVAECGCILQKPLRATALFEAMASCFLTDETPMALGDLYFFPRGRFLSAQEKPSTEREKLKLTEKEAAILHFLYSHSHEIVERDVLLASVWGYNSDIDTHTLETHVYRLRQKIAEFFKGKDLIVTQSGGYTLKK